MALFKEPLRTWLQRLEDLIASAGTGTVGGPGSALVNQVVLWANIGATSIKAALVTISAGGSITVPALETVDGRDVSVDGAALDAHIASSSNPHSVTATQVGLSAVTNDAQLKRSADDWSGFTAKTTPVAADLLLLEDSAAAGAKKKVAVSALTAGAGGLVETAIGSVSTDISTSSTSFVAMAGCTVTMTLTTGDIILINAAAGLFSADISFALFVDGSRSGPGSRWSGGGGQSLVHRITGLSAGSHTFDMRWKVASGTGVCNASSAADSHFASILVERTRV